MLWHPHAHTLILTLDLTRAHPTSTECNTPSLEAELVRIAADFANVASPDIDYNPAAQVLLPQGSLPDRMFGSI